MCYSDSAAPPGAPGASGKAHGEELTLTAGDGNQFYAQLAVPEGHTHSAVVIYPDVRGLHQFYRDLTLRFAEAGIAAIALDYFGRTAGLTSRAEGFEYMPHVEKLTIPTFTLDVQAALAALRAKVGDDAKVFIMGFCMGGSLTLVTGANKDLKASGLMPFYSGLKRNFGGEGTAMDFASRIAYPVLGSYGGTDEGIPESAIQELRGKLDQAGVEHNLKIYEGAPHSFFDRMQADYMEASNDAWRRMLAFIQSGHPQN